MPPGYETVNITVDDATIADGDIWKIIEPVWWLADIYSGPDEYDRSLCQFSAEQRLIFALQWYISEVNNGGHRQFYFNSTGVVWKDACKAFSAINIKKGADIILASADRMGGNPSLDRELRYEQLAKYNPGFDDLDDEFYQLEKTANIEQAVVAFIREHPSAFHFSDKISKVVLPNFTDSRRE